MTHAFRTRLRRLEGQYAEEQRRREERWRAWIDGMLRAYSAPPCRRGRPQHGAGPDRRAAAAFHGADGNCRRRPRRYRVPLSVVSGIALQGRHDLLGQVEQ